MIFVSPGVHLLGATSADGAPGNTPTSAKKPTAAQAAATQKLSTGPVGAWVRSGNQNCRTNPKVAGGRECVRYMNPGVQSLQQALLDLSTTTGNAGINPKGVDGVMGFNTRLALAQAMPVIGPMMGSTLQWLALALGVALLAAPDTANQYVGQYSAMITPAIQLATASYTPSAEDVPAVDPGAYSATGPAWYTTTWGKASIGVGALAVLALLFSSPPRA